ncbi:MAG: hypothetical protein AAGE98_09360 [Actinomycetota bacterium]
MRAMEPIDLFEKPGLAPTRRGRWTALCVAAIVALPLLAVPAAAQDETDPEADTEADDAAEGFIPDDAIDLEDIEVQDPYGIPGVFLPGEFGNTGPNDFDDVDTTIISGLEYLQAGFDPETRDPELYDAIDAIRLAEDDEEPKVTRLTGGVWVVPFVATGIGETVRLVGEVNETTFRIPVPEGTQPDRVRATMRISPDVDTGYIEYQVQGGSVKTINLGFRDTRGPQIEVELDLSDAEPRNGTVSITMRNRLRSDDPACTTTLVGAWVDFSDGVFILQGDPEPPKTVGQFVPLLLEEIQIYTPGDPSRAEAEAATRIVNAVVRNTLGNNPEITTERLIEPDRVPTKRYQTTVRTVVISSDMPAGARLVQTGANGVVLVIGGDGDQIDRISRAWAGDLSDLMAGTVVDVIRYDPDGLAQLTPDGIPILVDLDEDGEFDRYDIDNPPEELLALEQVDETDQFTTGIERNVDANGELIEIMPEERETDFTFEDLEVGRLRVTGVGRMELPIFVDQASFGGPVQDIKINLVGTYTPLAASAQATMSLFLNGILVDAINLQDGDGHFDYELHLDPELIGRNTSLSVVADYSPPSGWCRPGEIPFTLQLSPFSKFIVEPGEILPPGFERWPQTAVENDFHVALDTFSTGRLDLALRLVAALQRTTQEPMDATFVDVEDAADIDGPVVIVSASGPEWLDNAPLLATNPISVINDERIERLRFDVNTPHAVLEAFEFHDDDRLILTWNSGAEEDRTIGLAYASELVDSFSTRDLSWKILFGDTYLLSAGSPPLAIAVRDDEIQPSPTIAAPDYIARAIPLLIGAIFAGLVALVLNQLRVWRQRRKQEEDARAAMRLSMAHIADQLEIDRDETE